MSDSEIDAIPSFRAAFDLSVEEARQALAKCDYDCPYGHYTKCREFLLPDFVHCVGFSPVELLLFAKYLYPENTQGCLC